MEGHAVFHTRRDVQIFNRAVKCVEVAAGMLGHGNLKVELVAGACTKSTRYLHKTNIANYDNSVGKDAYLARRCCSCGPEQGCQCRTAISLHSATPKVHTAVLGTATTATIEGTTRCNSPPSARSLDSGRRFIVGQPPATTGISFSNNSCL
jgi:hypothetical protein